MDKPLPSIPTSRQDSPTSGSRASSDTATSFPAWGPNKGIARRRSSVDHRSNTQENEKRQQQQQQQREHGANGEGRDEDNIVDFEENDPEHPWNWPNWKKWMVLWSPLACELISSFGTTCISPAQEKFAADMGVSSVVAVLPLTMWVIGLGVGPLFLAPLSEWGGRMPVWIGGHALMTIFLILSAVVDSLGPFLLLRFLGGFAASMPVSNVGAAVADMWNPNETAPGQSLFVAIAVGSPALGYTLNSFIVQYRPWRHVLWATSGISGGMFVVLCVFTRETRDATILQKRCKRLKKETGNDKLEVPEKMRTKGWSELVKDSLWRPLSFQFTEPIVMACSLINIELYSVNYLFTTSYPLVFGENGHREWSTLQIGLAWLGIFIGAAVGPLTHKPQEKKFRRETEEKGGILVPERRLGLPMAAGILFPVSLFWFAWTSHPSIHWIVPILASVVFGWSFFSLILFVNQFITDGYGVFASSGLAATSLARNLAGGSFPLFGEAMYHKLGYEWATCLLAFLALLVTPVPFLFLRYGKALRKKSPWAKQHMEEVGEDVEDGEGREGDDQA
ncbi:hypothetical protein JCM8097_009058 [Rhodosporidiobolus ruineniae]